MEPKPETVEEGITRVLAQNKVLFELTSKLNGAYIKNDVARQASDATTKRLLTEAIQDAFGKEENSGRFIDTSRIPLICQDIKGIHGEVADIKDNLKWITRLIIGAVILALLGLVFVHGSGLPASST